MSMSHLEGYSTVRPPLFNGEDFSYWKRRMECFLKTDLDIWFTIRKGYTAPIGDSGESLDPEKWTVEMRRKAQIDFKALNTLQCGLTKEELNRVGPFENSKELWDKLVEIHEGSNDSKIAKRDMLLNKLFNCKMLEGETANQLHTRVKDILNGLHLIGHHVENRDIIRYTLKAFPRNNLWTSIVDAYKVSRDLTTVRLDELFCELELHEQANSSQVENSVALVAGTNKLKESKNKNKIKIESESESDSDSNQEEQLVNMVKKMFKKNKNKFRKNETKKVTNEKSKPRSEITCYECNGKGHYKNECPNLNSEKSRNGRKKKALKATWDESSSDESEDENPKTSFVAFMAGTSSDSESESEAESEYESGSESESSHGSASVSEGSNKVNLIFKENYFKIIKCLNKRLVKSEDQVKLLLKENKVLKKQVDLNSSTYLNQDRNSTQVAKLEEENSILKRKVEDLTGTLEKFTSGTKYLDMMLGTQRAVYNKTGLGFRTKTSNRSYMSLFRNKRTQVQAWVPKSCLVNKTGPNQFWIPKGQVHYVNKTYQAYDLGGDTKMVVTLLS